MKYEFSREFVFLLNNGEFARPVKMKSKETGNYSFRSAPDRVNKIGTDWETNEVEVSEDKMVQDVLKRGRRTRSVSPSQPTPSLRGMNSLDVVAVYVPLK